MTPALLLELSHLHVVEAMAEERDWQHERLMRMADHMRVRAETEAAKGRLATKARNQETRR